MDRRVIWAIILMMLVAVVPSFFLKPKPRARPAAAAQAEGAGPARAPDSAAARAPDSAGPAGAPVAAIGADTAARPAGAAAAPAVPETIVPVRSPLYAYGVSTRGGRIVSAEMLQYRSLAPADTSAAAGGRAGRDSATQLVRRGDAILAPALVVGGDTVDLSTWDFTPSATSLSVAGPQTLTLTAERGALGVTLAYTFLPDEYRIDVAGQVRGLGPNGGQLLLGLGSGLAQTEGDSVENYRSFALVTKQDDAERLDFASLDAGERRAVDGPFEWAAVKSKYFVAAVFAYDSSAGRSAVEAGRVSGVTATAGGGKNPNRVRVTAGLPVPASGRVAYRAYLGPMEYDRLKALGHEFDDVNPYGWPGFRTLIRFFAVPTRWLLVFMHESLGLSYGLVLIAFGLLVRIALWPLNSKAMRSSMAMQAIQPEMKRIQEKYAADPQRQQQEMFKLYKEHGVNPLGGCWPMLLPMPVLLALFFVFQNTIELRGAPFLWVPDLAQHDPLYIIPVVMALSMYGLTKVGQMGMEPNPQAKMMMYLMPAMMLIFFYRFAAGLNLYYAVSNIASIPQQWMLAKERMRRGARQIVEVKTKAPPGSITGKKKKHG